LQVTWIRKKDSQILAASVWTYSSHQRFQAVNKNETWSLMIQNVQKRDNGIYECELSRSPPTKTWVNLQVVDKEGNKIIIINEYNNEIRR